MNKVSKRTFRGQSLAELAAGMLVFVPIILLLIDTAVIMIGVSSNEAVCRDAARAAASGPCAEMLAGPERSVGPSGTPYKRAVAIVKEVYLLGGLVKVRQNPVVKELLKEPLPGSARGGPLIGQVSVQTTCEVYPPFLIRAFVEHGVYLFKNTQIYPYTYVMPPVTPAS